MKFNVKILILLVTTLVSANLITACNSGKDETLTEKAKELGNDTKRGASELVRDVKDETCEMINGKMECAAKEVKHSIQSGADKVEDAVD